MATSGIDRPAHSDSETLSLFDLEKLSAGSQM
jgi:hypothetical protein